MYMYVYKHMVIFSWASPIPPPPHISQSIDGFRQNNSQGF